MTNEGKWSSDLLLIAMMGLVDLIRLGGFQFRIRRLTAEKAVVVYTILGTFNWAIALHQLDRETPEKPWIPRN